MQVLSCDVLVVGAGPAGSSAARRAAEDGARTILLDRRLTVGSPVQCAEYIPIQLLGEVELTPDCLAQVIDGMKTFLPGKPERVTSAKGCMVHRDRFDRWLMECAVEAGAELMRGTRAVAMDAAGAVLVSRRGEDGEPMRIKASVVVGADGPRSTVGRWVGAVNRNLLAGVQVTLPLCAPANITEVYFEPHIFGGYGWFFPKNDQVNIGLGMLRPGPGERSIMDILGNFAARFVAADRADGRILSRAGGWIPAEPLRSAVHGNVILAGDAAGHTHPITGAGIHSAVVCGKMAGKHAARAALSGNVKLLKAYDDEWQGLLGTSLSRAAHRRGFMENRWDEFDATIRRSWVAFKEYYAR